MSLQGCLLALVCSFCILYTTTAQETVCYTQASSQEILTEYFQSSYRDTYSCGLFGWSRCTRTLYRPNFRQFGATVYRTVFGCCPGYEQVDIEEACRPACSGGGCLNGGECIGPNRCRCPFGWMGNNCEIDIDECSIGTDTCEDVCTNVPGFYVCSCSRPGYQLSTNTFTCIEINECRDGTAMCEHTCTNNDGSFECSCDTGYTLENDERNCVNDNECFLGTHLCEQNCHDSGGSYLCSCNAGYSLDRNGLTCSDTDECDIGTNSCEQNCQNTVGSYTCSCRPGYSLNANGKTCDILTECDDSDAQNCDELCLVINDVPVCDCSRGYMLDGDESSCSDIDECATDTHFCDQLCHNNIGSFDCTCHPGTNLDINGFTCNDIDECESPELHNCQHSCVNTYGSYFCQCDPGYQLNPDARTCSDADECAMGTHACEQNCMNTIGSFTCSCDDGFSLNGDLLTCDDIDECSPDVDCVDICTNTIGSYFCSCREGFSLTEDGFNCIDIDECSNTTTNRCDQECTNTIGSYTCSCGAGFIIDVDGSTCNDVDECGGDFDHMCMETCRNTLGSFECACTAGYVLDDDGRSCIDLNECEAETDQCEQNCQNTIGSYNCSCTNAYTLSSNGFGCDDIDECLAGSIGDTTCEVCENTMGSYTCGCNPGRVLMSDGVSCRDEDECTEGKHQCDQMCTDTIGSYTCSCNSTTTLNADSFSCDDVDECADGTANCDEVCVNVYGSHYCSCTMDGYAVNADGRTCSDVNECFLDIDLCEHICTNTDNSYTCQCNNGFTLVSNTFNCLSFPEDIVFDTVESTTMTLTWGLPANDSDDGNILSYPVICNSNGHESFSLDLTVPVADERLAVLQSLLPYTAYNCCVSVQTDRGRSPSFCIKETTLEDAPSTIPDSVTLINDEIDSLTVAFQPPVIPNGVIIAYTFYVAFENGSSLTLVERSLTRVFTIEGLQPYQQVEVQVSANTSIGEGPLSGPDTTRTAQSVPSAPTRLAVEVLSSTRFSVAWSPPIVFNGVLLGYTVRVFNLLNNYMQEFLVSSAATRTVTVTELEPAVPYTVEVTASTIIGEGEVISQYFFTDHGVPNTPTLDIVVRLSVGVAKLVWTPLTPDEARGVLTQLDIMYQPASNGRCLAFNDNNSTLVITKNVGTLQNAEITGLDESLEYCVAIQVRTSAGESGFSNILKAHLSSDLYVQIRMRLLTDEICPTFVTEDAVEKATDVSSTVVDALLSHCNCFFTVEHIAHSRLLCGRDNKEVIFQANILNTENRAAPELMILVQRWVYNRLRFYVGGSAIRIDDYCAVSVNEVGDTDECDAIDPTIGTVVAILEATLPEVPRVPNDLIPVIAGIAGAVVGTILLLVIVTILICCCERSKRVVKQDPAKKIGKGLFSSQSHLITQSHQSMVSQTPYNNPLFNQETIRDGEAKEDSGSGSFMDMDMT